MKPNRKLVLAVVSGIAMGIAGSAAIRGGEVKTAPGYLISESEITDPAKIQEYGARIHETLTPFHHQIIIGAGKTTSLEGEPPKSFVVIAFDSVERAQAWYDSPAYAAINRCGNRPRKVVYSSPKASRRSEKATATTAGH